MWVPMSARVRSWLDGGGPSSPFPSLWIGEVLALGSKLYSLTVERDTFTVTSSRRVREDRGVFLVDASAGPVELTIPYSARTPGTRLVVVKTDTTDNAVTVVSDDVADRFDGQLTAPALTVRWAALTLAAPLQGLDGWSTLGTRAAVAAHQAQSVRTVTSSGLITAADGLVVVDTTTGPVDLTLPDPDDRLGVGPARVKWLAGPPGNPLTVYAPVGVTLDGEPGEDGVTFSGVRDVLEFWRGSSTSYLLL